MSHTKLNKTQQLIHNALLERAWVTDEQMTLALAALAHEAEPRLERYFLQQKIIQSKQAEHLALFYDMVPQIAEFEIDDIIGAGAMGVVYLGHDTSGREVAIKVINKKHCDDEEFIKRFERETNIVTDLQHDSIVAALNAGSIGEDMYLATEFVNGPSLAEMLDDFGPLPEPYVLKCMLQVADGLEHAYKKGGLVHRDMKPPNILIEHGPESKKTDLEPHINIDVAKVIDFGLAKKTNDTEHLTLTGLTVGTPHYMAPEQIRADPDLDCRVDIYSLGTTMYHLLTGQTPFRGNSPGAIMLAHVNEDVPNPSEIIPSLRQETVDLVMLAMAKNRDDRYTNYSAFKQALKEAMKACGDEGSGMRVLRKPLVVKSKLRKKKSEPRMSSIADQARPVADPNAVTKRTERVANQATTRRKPITVKEEAPRKGSSSMLRLVQQRMFSHKTSAAFEEDIDQRMGVSLWVWLALVASLIFMLITIIMRYV